MSHFTVGVIVPKLIYEINEDEFAKQKFIESYIAMLMSPFDENFKIAAYDKKCYCVGSVARRDARIHASKVAGNIEDLQEQYWATEEDIRPEWEIVIAPYIAAEEEFLANHSLKDTPDPECEECSGTGFYKSTYNPVSKWDWYSIGGRWDGMVLEIERDDGDSGFNFGAEYHQLKHNSIPIATLVDRFETNSDKLFKCFAYLTPECEWVERGTMGWWAVVIDEKSESDWKAQIIEIYRRFKDHYLVVIDAHI